MKKSAILANLLLPFFSMPVMAQVVEYDSAWGKNCHPSKDSYAVKVKNNTGKPVDIKVCLEKKAGNWACFVSSKASPGQVVPSSWGYFVCHGTGRSKWWWRDVGDYSTRFPKP